MLKTLESKNLEVPFKRHFNSLLILVTFGLVKKSTHSLKKIKSNSFFSDAKLGLLTKSF
jgi:hypothetical protein